MNSSRHIAGLTGPAAMAITVSEAMNYHIWAHAIPTVTYLNGTMLFVAGLAIVRFHNRWTMGWPVMVTLSGWILIAGGLLRMFAPQTPPLPQSALTYAFIAALFAGGAFLTFKAYWPSRESQVRS
jgi:hypothetical protein